MAEYFKRGERFWITYQKDGKRIRKALKTSEGRPVKDEKVAKFLTNQIENEISIGNSPIPSSNKSPRIVLEEYNNYAKGFKSEHTIRTDRSLIKKFLDKVDPLRLGQIDKDTVKSYLDGRIAAKEISHVSANDTIKTLKTFINFAVQKNYLTRNTISDLPKYKVNVLPPVFLQKKEIIDIINAAKEETLYPAIMTAIYTGMRLGELRRLQWSDINLDKQIITVMESKSGQFREIPIHEDLVLNKSDLPFDFTNYQKVFNRIKRKAKIRDIGFHTFRHTFASQLIMAGVNIVEVSELLGHADISTTMIYAHLTKDHLKDSINKLKIVSNDVTENVSRETRLQSVSIGNSSVSNFRISDDNSNS